MDLQYLSDRYAVSAQLGAADMAKVKALGFTTVICNRPDGEVEGQPTIAEVSKAATDAGMVYHVLPMHGLNCTVDQLSQLQHLLSEAPGKVLAYCRSGRRSSVIWQSLQQAQEKQPEV